MAENPFVVIQNSDGGGDIRGKINIVSSDSEISMRYVSEFAEIENEIGYFITGTTVFAKAEAKWYKYNGAVWVEETDLLSADSSSLSDDEILAWDFGNSRWENKSLTFESLISLEVYDSTPERGSVSDIHGGLLSLVTAQPLNSSPTNINISQGIGKVFFVLNAGSDFTGSIIVTGTSVDRETGAETPADTDTISVNALSTDGSDTDANGNIRYSFQDAYITSKWFTGSIVVSTSDLTLTNVDVYHCSFEQFNDSEQIVVETFDINLLSININAKLDAYLYSVVVTGDKVDITRESSLNLGTPIANRYYRLRRGNINKAINGLTDGIFMNIHYANNPSYIEDMNMKVWATKTQSIIFL